MAAEEKGTARAERREHADVHAHKRGRISRARSLTVLAVFLLIVVGLFAQNGWGTLSSMGIGAIAALCPLGAIETLIASHTIIPRSLVAAVIGLVLVALFGRFFCSWICPVPPIGAFFHSSKKKGARAAAAEEHRAAAQAQADAAAPDCAEGVQACAPDAGAHSGEAPADEASIRREVDKLVGHKGCASCASGCGLPPVGGKRDGVHIDSRHGVLLGALASAAIFGFPVFCLVCPVGLSIATVVCLYRAIFEQTPTLSLLVFPLILLVELVFFRKWCHKLCPMGALMSLVGARAPFAKPRVNEAACLREKGIDCRVCVQTCPEGIDPHSTTIPECTKCGLCVEACPAKAISFRKQPRIASAACNSDDSRAE